MSRKERTIDLMHMLCNVWDDKDFVLGVCVHLKTEEKVNEMIDWLNKHKDEQIESDEILAKALEIRYEKKLDINGIIVRD